MLWRILEWPIALLWHSYATFVGLTSRVSVTGNPPAEPAIFVNWHRYQSFLIPHHGAYGRWMLVSPAARLAPVARFCKLSGLNLVRGASGDRGKQALQELAQVLHAGGSVTIAVDGPAGPSFQAKRGCADLAARTRSPIVPVNFRSSRGLTLAKRWDQTLLPTPFDRIIIRYGPPIMLASGSDELLEAVQQGLTSHDAV